MNKNNAEPKACDSKQTASPLLDNTVVTPNKPSFSTRVKIITYGKMMDVEVFEIPIRIGVPPRKRVKKELNEEEVRMALVNPEIYRGLITDRNGEYRKRTAYTAVTNIRRLVQANFDMASVFITLTFANTNTFDITSLTDCHDKFETFITKLRRKFPQYGFVYLAVPEFQKRGAVHFHMISDLPYIPVEIYRKFWPYGFLKVNKIKTPEMVGIYMAKYMGKSVYDDRFKGHRLYYCSRGLKKPVVRYGDKYLEKVDALREKGVRPIFTKIIPTEKNGKKLFSSYTFYKTPAQKEKDGQP